MVILRLSHRMSSEHKRVFVEMSSTRINQKLFGSYRRLFVSVLHHAHYDVSSSIRYLKSYVTRNAPAASVGRSSQNTPAHSPSFE